MNENTSGERRGHRLGHDALGFVLIGIGGFLGASVVMWLIHPQEEPGGTTKLVTDLVGLLGAAPILWLCAGLLFVGARLFLGGVGVGIGRDLLGFAATCLGLIVALGSLKSTLAGSLGSATGGAASAMVPFLGLILGVALFAMSAWYFWLRQPAPRPRELEQVFSTSAAAPPAARPEARVDGVTAEEAAVLLPPEAFPPREALRVALRDANPNSPSTVSSAPSPYPTDVRRQGGIPDGARPIQPAAATRAQPSTSAPSPLEGLTPRPSSHDRNPQQDPSQPVGVHHWSAQRPAGASEPARADLAPDARVVRPAGTRAPTADRDAGGHAQAGSRSPAEGSAVLRPTPGVAGGAAVIAPMAAQSKTPTADVGHIARRDEASAPGHTSRSSPETAQPAQSAAGAPPIIASGATPIASPTSGGPLPSPSWEQPDLFQPPEEPVDAYGTPMSLVEALRADGTAASESETDDETAEDEAEDAEESELDEMALEDDDGEELDVDEEPEVEVVLTVDEEELATEPLLSVEDEPIDVSDDIESGDELADEPAEADDDEEELEVAARVVSEAAPAAEVVEPRPGLVQRSLLDVVEEAEPPTKPRSPSKTRKASEPVHVLQPQTAPPPAPKSPAAKPAAAASGSSGSKQASKPASEAEPGATVVDEGLVFRAGCMFLERKRVAVSMLQREFGLDFKQATDVLDQLQSSGLIGPYLGGQRRDILLTPEQWRERVGAR